MSIRYKALAACTCAALTVALGLVGCGGSSAETETAATETTATEAEAEGSTEEQAQESEPKTMASTGAASFSAEDVAWLGMTDYGMVYYVDDEASGQAAFMVYYTGDNTFTRYVGPAQKDGNSVTITDNISGRTTTLELTGPDADNILTISFGEEAPVTTSASSFAEVQGTFDQVDLYATERE